MSKPRSSTTYVSSSVNGDGRGRKRVLILFGNRPLPLPTETARLLASCSEYKVDLLYWDRQRSHVAIPLALAAEKFEVSAVRWPEGKRLLPKIVSRTIVVFLLVRRVRAFRPDVIHAWDVQMLLAGRIAETIVPQSPVPYFSCATPSERVWEGPVL